MKQFNAALTKIFDALCWPFLALEPIWAMIAISLLTGVVMLWIFGKISNQDAIKGLKDKIRGNLIGVRLFQHDLKVVFLLQSRIIALTLTYMKHSVVPMLVMMPPVLLIIIQLHLRFEARPLMPGETALVKVKLRDASGLAGGETSLKGPAEGFAVETPPVRIESEREASWRIRAEKPGRYTMVVQLGGGSVEKTLVVGNRWGATPLLRTGKNLMDKLLYPGEPPIPADSPIESVEIVYPKLEMQLFGFGAHWLIWFFVLSVAFGFALKGFFGVQI